MPGRIQLLAGGHRCQYPPSTADLVPEATESAVQPLPRLTFLTRVLGCHSAGVRYLAISFLGSWLNGTATSKRAGSKALVDATCHSKRAELRQCRRVLFIFEIFGVCFCYVQHVWRDGATEVFHFCCKAVPGLQLQLHAHVVCCDRDVLSVSKMLHIALREDRDIVQVHHTSRLCILIKNIFSARWSVASAFKSPKGIWLIRYLLAWLVKDVLLAFFRHKHPSVSLSYRPTLKILWCPRLESIISSIRGR